MSKIYVEYNITKEVLGNNDIFSHLNSNMYKIKLFNTVEEAIEYVKLLNYGDCSYNKCNYLEYKKTDYIIKEYISSIYFEDKKDLYIIKAMQIKTNVKDYPVGIQVVLEIYRKNVKICSRTMIMDYTTEKIEDFILKELSIYKHTQYKPHYTYLGRKLDIRFSFKLEDKLSYYCFAKLLKYFYKDFKAQINKKITKVLEDQQ